MDHDIVVFRKWRHSGDIIALFPTQPEDLNGLYCNSYEHIGQHGGADYYRVILSTTPASVAESTALAEELTRIGYNLKPIKRAMPCHHEQRCEAAKVLKRLI
jgi:hypothetical protein